MSAVKLIRLYDDMFITDSVKLKYAFRLLLTGTCKHNHHIEYITCEECPINDDEYFVNECFQRDVSCELHRFIRDSKYIIDDMINEWHKSDSDLELYEYLGMSLEQYTKYVETGEVG